MFTCTQSQPPSDKAPCTPVWIQPGPSCGSRNRNIISISSPVMSVLNVSPRCPARGPSPFQSSRQRRSWRRRGGSSSGRRSWTRGTGTWSAGLEKILYNPFLDFFWVLTLVLISRGGEEDTQTGLEVDWLAGWVPSTGLDTVIEYQGSWLAVKHVLRGSVCKSWQ